MHTNETQHAQQHSACNSMPGGGGGGGGEGGDCTLNCSSREDEADEFEHRDDSEPTAPAQQQVQVSAANLCDSFGMPLKHAVQR